MSCVGVAAGPHFMQEKRTAGVRGAMQVIDQAALFLTGGNEKRPELRLHQEFLPFFGAQNHYQGHGIFRKFSAGIFLRLACARFSF